MELKPYNFIGNGFVVLPRSEYDDLMYDQKKMIEESNALYNDNLKLREMYASLKLPSPDLIDKDSLDVREYVNEFNHKRERYIKFTYTPNE